MVFTFIEFATIECFDFLRKASSLHSLPFVTLMGDGNALECSIKWYISRGFLKCKPLTQSVRGRTATAVNAKNLTLAVAPLSQMEKARVRLFVSIVTQIYLCALNISAQHLFSVRRLTRPPPPAATIICHIVFVGLRHFVLSSRVSYHLALFVCELKQVEWKLLSTRHTSLLLLLLILKLGKI